MNNHKHTPGPWHISHIGIDEFRKEIIFDANHGQIAEVLEETNTFLIAAAPDLLEVAKGALAYLQSLPDCCKPDEGWLKPLIETIDRAEGK